jgi:hypothetical protein
MKRFTNIFINDITKADQFCFVIDDSRYYKFNGSYALYDFGMLREKEEYAQRCGNAVEGKQVYGLYTDHCPECNRRLVNVPVIKRGANFACYCEHCNVKISPEGIMPIVSVLSVHVNRSECIDYEELALDLKEED